MSDTKKRVNGDAGPPSTPKGTRFGERFQERLSKIVGLCTELKNDTAGAMDYEKTMEENATLKSMLKKRDDELDTLKKEIEDQKRLRSVNLRDYGDKYAEFLSKLKEGESSKKLLGETREALEKAKKDLKRLETENKQLEKKARETEAGLKKAEQKLSETESELGDIQSQLTAKENKIRFYCEDTLFLVDARDVMNKFGAFAEKCHEVVMDCINSCEVPPKNVPFLTTYLEKCPGRRLSLPLTNSTSNSARLMRCAAVELAIAHALVKHIFTDIYIPGDINRQTAISTTLELLAKKNSKREGLVRCQLLAEVDVEGEELSKVCQAAFDELWPVLEGLLPAGPRRDQFHGKLMALLNEARDLWRPLQKSKKRISAHLFVGTNMLKRDEDFQPDYDMTGLQGEARPSSPGFAFSQPVSLLFPLICSEEQTFVIPTALWSDQAAWVEAVEVSENRFSLNGSMISAIDHNRPLRRMSTGVRTPQSPTFSMPPAGATTALSDVSTSHLVPTRRSESGRLTNRGR